MGLGTPLEGRHPFGAAGSEGTDARTMRSLVQGRAHPKPVLPRAVLQVSGGSSGLSLISRDFCGCWTPNVDSALFLQPALPRALSLPSACGPVLSSCLWVRKNLYNPEGFTQLTLTLLWAPAHHPHTCCKLEGLCWECKKLQTAELSTPSAPEAVFSTFVLPGWAAPQSLLELPQGVGL